MCWKNALTEKQRDLSVKQYAPSVKQRVVM